MMHIFLYLVWPHRLKKKGTVVSILSEVGPKMLVPYWPQQQQENKLSLVGLSASFGKCQNATCEYSCTYCKCKTDVQRKTICSDRYNIFYCGDKSVLAWKLTYIKLTKELFISLPQNIMLTAHQFSGYKLCWVHCPFMNKPLTGVLYGNMSSDGLCVNMSECDVQLCEFSVQGCKW